MQTITNNKIAPGRHFADRFNNLAKLWCGDCKVFQVVAGADSAALRLFCGHFYVASAHCPECGLIEGCHTTGCPEDTEAAPTENFYGQVERIQKETGKPATHVLESGYRIQSLGYYYELRDRQNTRLRPITTKVKEK